MTSTNEQLISIIDNRISAHERIPDMVLDDLIDLVAKTCREICAPIDEASPASAEVEDKIVDATFGSLVQRLQDMFVYELFDELTSDMAFRFGACWGGITAVEKCEEHQQDSENEKEELRFIKKYQRLFDEIKGQPGRCHHEIAIAAGFSDARLSQIIKESKSHQLISTSIQGRNKHYYLTRKGEERYLACFGEDDSMLFRVDSRWEAIQTNRNEQDSSDQGLFLLQATAATDNVDAIQYSMNRKANDNYPPYWQMLEGYKNVRV